ncbi:MAG: hypothetical protein ACXW2E_00655 [Nitrososphaeraceae archaeon]
MKLYELLQEALSLAGERDSVTQIMKRVYQEVTNYTELAIKIKQEKKKQQEN